jgi:hypothetical protein
MKRKLIPIILTLAAQLCFLSAHAKGHPASGIVVDRAGNIYFSDLETVWKLDASGKLSVFRPGVPGRHVHELSIDEQDNIYGADISYVSEKWISDVWRMTPEGKFAYLLEPTDNAPRGMSIWRDRQGNMYLVDQNNHLKQQTLLLRRTPEGKVSTLAGSAYGHADGKGVAARFSSVGGMAFGLDDSLYLTDGTFVRRVMPDGTVTTVASDLNVRTSEDKPTLFGGLYGNLAGLGVDGNGNVYVADAGNRRLLKIESGGKVAVLLRTEPPFFPNGVAAARGNLYVLEVGLTLPNLTSGPRIRKITPDGKSVILATAGSEGGAENFKAAVARRAGVAAENFLSFFLVGERIRYSIALLSASILLGFAIIWRRYRRQRL